MTSADGALFPRRVQQMLILGWMAILLASIGWLAVRAWGEAARTKAIVAAAAADLQDEIRADCAFKLDLADLPKTIHPRGAGLVKIATDARYAYIAKGCEMVGPPAPPLYKADPSPTPLRTPR